MNKNKINPDTPLLQNYIIRGEKESLNSNCTEKSAKVHVWLVFLLSTIRYDGNPVWRG
jgi:hypothetical protein